MCTLCEYVVGRRHNHETRPMMSSTWAARYPGVPICDLSFDTVSELNLTKLVVKEF